METKKKVELPLLEPIYSTYHNQGPGSAVLTENPSIRNWFLNQAAILFCNRKFLKGFTTPEISVLLSLWSDNPYFHKQWYNVRYLMEQVHYVIKHLLDDGYYVCFNEVDDYYVEGKSWYQEEHFSHDGCICGYDEENETYCIYAYDRNWVYRKFWTPQKSFHEGLQAQFDKNAFGYICGIKPRLEQVEFSSTIALDKITQYLDSTIEKYPENGEGAVFGIVVHDYIAKYIDKLSDGSIPYERMDRRIFRLIWEHKKAMLERIRLIESELLLDNDISESYKKVVQEANDARMLYAAHRMKRRDSVLPVIREKLLHLKSIEQDLLETLLAKAKEEK